MPKRAALMALLLSLGLPAQEAQDAKDAKDAKEAQAAQARGQRPPPRPPRPGAAKDPQEPIFRIGDRVFREADLIDYLPIMMPAARAEQVKGDPRALADARKNFADQMVLMSAALKDGLDRRPEYQARLAGVTKWTLVEESRKLAPAPESVQPTEEQMRAYFEQNADAYRSEESARARHILIPIGKDEGKGKSGEAKALEAAKRVAKELKAGKGWDEMAKKYSEDPGSRDKGGLYENFPPAGMVTEFAEAVRSQAIGEVGPPVKTQYGFHVIMVESLAPARQLTFDEAREGIRRQLAGRMLQEARAAYVESLKERLGYSETDFDVPEPPPPPQPAKGKGRQAPRGR
jgi:hypothetical protein